MLTGRDVARRMLVIAAAAALGALAACNVPEMVRFPDYVGPAGPAEAQQAAAAESKLPAPPPETAEAAGPLRVAVPDAILIALQNNRAFIVDRYNVPITRTAEQQQLAAFDPDLTGTFSLQRAYNQVDSPPPAQTELGLLGLSEFLPTGTLLNLSAGETVMKWPTVPAANYPSLPGNYATNISLTATQSLLRGYGLDVNLASLRQARLDTRSSEYELRGFAESLVAQTEEAYWDCALAQQQIQITEKSLGLANDQLRETLDRIQLGNVAATEKVAAEAEVALRQEDLINARSAFDAARLLLLRLLSPSGNTFERDLVLLDQPSAKEEPTDNLADHIQAALRMRPDLNQARLLVERDELQIVKTKNGMLPQLNLFITLGRTGYSSSFPGSVSNLSANDYDALVGVNFEYPPANRAAKAADAAARLARGQADQAVGNLAQLVELDVRTAYIEILRTRAQVVASLASRTLQEEKVRVEAEKFRIGKSTSLLVAEAQRDLLSSQIAYVQAVAGYRKALVELYRLEGTLLQRRGLAAPGSEPPR
ncbi:MAG: TolC family protein [Candidatus Brocadiia bacterium]